jgi:hypothetical protein
MPPISPAEMQVLVSRAGLMLNPGQMADLVLAWRQVVALLGLIPRDRPVVDDQAFVFRLPPPDIAAKPVATARARPTGAAATKPPPRQKPAGKTSAAKKPPGKKPTAGKTAGEKQVATRKSLRSLSSGRPSARPGGRR